MKYNLEYTHLCISYLPMNPVGQALSTIQTIAINRMESVSKRNALFSPSLIPSWVILGFVVWFVLFLLFFPEYLMAFLIGVEGSSLFAPSTLLCAVFYSVCSRWVCWNGMDISAPSLHLQGDFSMDQLQHNMMLVGQSSDHKHTSVFLWYPPPPSLSFLCS